MPMSTGQAHPKLNPIQIDEKSRELVRKRWLNQIELLIRGHDRKIARRGQMLFHWSIDIDFFVESSAFVCCFLESERKEYTAAIEYNNPLHLSAKSRHPGNKMAEQRSSAKRSTVR